MKPDVLASCSDLITTHFQLDKVELVHSQQSKEALTQALAQIINTLLNQDLGRLMNIFYRMDLSESVFKQIITEASPDEVGVLLAKAVIKRELQKVKTREQYK